MAKGNGISHWQKVTEGDRWRTQGMPACFLADAEKIWIVSSGSAIGPWGKISSESSDCDRGCGLGSLGQDQMEKMPESQIGMQYQCDPW